MTKTLMKAVALILATAVAAWAVVHVPALPKDLESFKHVGSLVIPDKLNPLFGVHHFYQNDKGMAAFRKSGPYPDGTTFVGKVYEAEDQGGPLNEGKLLFYTYMEKNKQVADTGGWIFAAFSPEGKLLQKDAKKDCFECHAPQKASDYVFSKPLS